jgi:dihydrofolate reductase
MILNYKTINPTGLFRRRLQSKKVKIMKMSLIVAVSRNGVIGLNNQLPWRLPDDLQYFKSVTMGKPLVMGRKTYDSIGRPLPGRTNIVITRDASWSAPGVNVATTLDEALLLARKACLDSGVDEVMVIGGEQIYRMTITVADRLYVTEVDAEIAGDAFFPTIDPQQWQRNRVELPEVTGSYSYQFVVLDRIKA